MLYIDLTGEVGVDFTAASVRASLRPGGDVRVTLNSAGGFASEGAAIHSALTSHVGKVVIEIVGIAASAASLLAMAGDEVIMRAGSVMMIHDPMNITVGNSADHAKTIEQLETIATAYARIYAAKAGISEQLARAMMRSEVWLTGEEAVAEGFATSTSDTKAKPFAHYDVKHQHKIDATLARASAKRTAAAKPVDAKAAWARTIAKCNAQVNGAKPNSAGSWAKAIAKANAGQR